MERLISKENQCIELFVERQASKRQASTKFSIEELIRKLSCLICAPSSRLFDWHSVRTFIRS